MLNFSKHLGLGRHTLVVLAIILDLGSIILAFIVNHNDIFLSTNGADYEAQRLLPAVGAILGAIVSGINGAAIADLVTTYARRRIIGKGMNFATMSYLHCLANAGLPIYSPFLIILGATIILAKGLLPSGIVASLTPTDTRWSASRSMPLAEFSSASGITPNIWCEYYDTISHNGTLEYGYGINCPIDTAYGEIYNAGLQSLQGVFPVNSSRNGVSYPSELLGISGAISTLTSRYVSRVTNDSSRSVATTDTLDVCVARMVVSTNCNGTMPDGIWFNMTYWTPIPGGVPQGMVEVQLCINDTGGCDIPGARYAPHFAGGVIIAFWTMDPTSGNTTLSLYNFGTYANSNPGMGSPTIQCITGAHEEIVPVRITGGVSVESWPELDCPTQPPADPQFILNVTRLADMAFIKAQGIDGSFQPAEEIPNGTDPVAALALALQRMVSIGATEMYANLDLNVTAQSLFAESVDYTYTTTRTRLGTQSGRSLAFVISPFVLLTIVTVGWVLVGFRTDADVPFNPLSPACTAAAGMNRAVLPPALIFHSAADQAALEKLPLVLRYGNLTGTRMGLDPTDGQPFPHVDEGRMQKGDLPLLPFEDGLSPHKTEFEGVFDASRMYESTSRYA